MDIIDAAPAGILKLYPVNQHSVWGLEPAGLKSTTDVVRFACETCFYDVSVPEQDQKIWQNMPCLNHRCQGRFKVQEHYDVDYYRALYGAGDVCRFVPREHTGLLTPRDREEVEKTFMRTDRHSWDPNIVSCTPNPGTGDRYWRSVHGLFVQHPPVTGKLCPEDGTGRTERWKFVWLCRSEQSITRSLFRIRTIIRFFAERFVANIVCTGLANPQ